MTDIHALDETGIQFVAKAKQIAENVAAPHAADVDRNGRFPNEAVDALLNDGFGGLAIAAEFGGHEQPPSVFAAVVEQLAQACASTAMIYVMHVCAARVVVASGSLARREQLLHQIAAGGHLTTLAFSERGSRSHFWAPLSRLEPDQQSGFRTSAAKSWVTSAHRADSYVSSAQMPGAASPQESTLYLVDRDAAGVNVAGSFDGLGLRGNDSAPVELANVSISEQELLTAQGEGMAMMLGEVLPWFCVGTSAMAHGLCLAAIAGTQTHLCSAGFEHEGTRLRDLPTLRARLAEMHARTEQSRALLQLTLRALASPDEQTPLYVLQTRLSALEAAVDVTDLAMKSCGGAAFSKHLGIERHFRDARAGWVMAPTVDVIKEFVGRALTDLPML